MTRLLRLALLLLIGAPVAAQPAPDLVRIPVDIGIWRHVSLSDALLRDTTQRALNHVALALPLHQAGQLEGVAVGVFGTAYEESVVGIQASGLANVAGGDAAAVQVAGLANVVGERMTGVQASGLANVAGGEMRGLQAAGLANVIGENGGFVQAAGLANIAGERFVGIQASGLANIVGEEFRGIQSSGLGNIAGENADGLQVAGIANIAGENVRGLQSAGIANIAGEDLLGVQAALFNVVGETMRGAQFGLVNVASESAGLQVGLVNVAGEQRGVPIGLYSRTGGVPVHLDVWTDETAALHVGVRSGSAVVSNYVGISARPFADAALRWGAFVGLGVEQPIGRRTAWGLDAFAHSLFAEDFGGSASTPIRLRFAVARDLGGRLSIFGGPALSLFLSDEDDGESLAPFSIYDDANADGTGGFVRMWPGLEAGLRIRITGDRSLAAKR
jgi:hypothetical protein